MWIIMKQKFQQQDKMEKQVRYAKQSRKHPFDMLKLVLSLGYLFINRKNNRGIWFA